MKRSASLAPLFVLLCVCFIAYAGTYYPDEGTAYCWHTKPAGFVSCEGNPSDQNYTTYAPISRYCAKVGCKCIRAAASPANCASNHGILISCSVAWLAKSRLNQWAPASPSVCTGNAGGCPIKPAHNSGGGCIAVIDGFLQWCGENGSWTTQVPCWARAYSEGSTAPQNINATAS